MYKLSKLFRKSFKLMLQQFLRCILLLQYLKYVVKCMHIKFACHIRKLGILTSRESTFTYICLMYNNKLLISLYQSCVHYDIYLAIATNTIKSNKMKHIKDNHWSLLSVSLAFFDTILR